MDLPDRQLLDAAPDAMVVVDPAGSIVLVNQQTESLFGYSRDELIGQPIESLIPERYHTHHSDHTRAFFKKPRVRSMGDGLELYAKCKDGTETPVEQGLTGILESSLNEIYIFDARSLRFIQVNEGARKNIGYSMDELRRLTPADIKPEHTEESFRDVIAPLLNAARSKIEFETIHERKGGSSYPVEVHLQYTALSSSTVFVAIFIDITERKRAEAIFGVDLAGNCTFSNAALIKLLGYESESDLIGKNIHALTHHSYPGGTDYPIRECQVSKAPQAGEPCHVDSEVFWPVNGSSLPVEYWSYPIWDKIE
jgi:PAS domain S-box-containing protein